MVAASTSRPDWLRAHAVRRGMLVARGSVGNGELGRWRARRTAGIAFGERLAEIPARLPLAALFAPEAVLRGARRIAGGVHAARDAIARRARGATRGAATWRCAEDAADDPCRDQSRVPAARSRTRPPVIAGAIDRARGVATQRVAMVEAAAECADACCPGPCRRSIPCRRPAFRPGSAETTGGTAAEHLRLEQRRAADQRKRRHVT